MSNTPQPGYGAVGRIPKPDTAPPPPYSEFIIPGHGASSSSIPHHSSSPPIPHGFPQPQYTPYPYPNVPPNLVPYQGPIATAGNHHQFGPTPLNDTMLLPYAFYSERAIVDARARWRFCNALLCALGIYVGVVFLVGVEGFGDGWWSLPGPGPQASS